jgi:hypothetical protein
MGMGIELEDSEPIEPFCRPAPIERVFLDSEVKLYRAQVNLMYLDGKVFNFEDTVLDFPAAVPVFTDSGKTIGFANLSHNPETGEFKANIAIDYASEERLLAETRSERLYARPYGTMAFAPMLFLDPSASLKPTKMKIQGITLSRTRSADDRCKPFGEPQ